MESCTRPQTEQPTAIVATSPATSPHIADALAQLGTGSNDVGRRRNTWGAAGPYRCATDSSAVDGQCVLDQVVGADRQVVEMVGAAPVAQRAGTSIITPRRTGP